MDILKEFLPIPDEGKCATDALAEVKGLMESIKSDISINSITDAHFFVYNALSKQLDLIELINCALENKGLSDYLKLLKTKFEWTAIVTKTGVVGNTLLGISQWAYDTPNMELCYKKEKNEINECGHEETLFSSLPDKSWTMTYTSYGGSGPNPNYETNLLDKTLVWRSGQNYGWQQTFAENANITIDSVQYIDTVLINIKWRSRTYLESNIAQTFYDCDGQSTRYEAGENWTDWKEVILPILFDKKSGKYFCRTEFCDGYAICNLEPTNENGKLILVSSKGISYTSNGSVSKDPYYYHLKYVFE